MATCDRLPISQTTLTFPYPTEPVEKGRCEAFVRQLTENYDDYVREEQRRASFTAATTQNIVLV
jgi:predicted HAD superfamily phosphohydrolase